MHSKRPDVLAPIVRYGTNRDGSPQEGYTPIEGALVKDPQYETHPDLDFNTVLYAFAVDEFTLMGWLERARRDGDEATLYVSLLTFGRAPQGIRVHSSIGELVKTYDVEPVDLKRLTGRLRQAVSQAGPNPTGDEEVSVRLGDLLAVLHAGKSLALDSIPFGAFVPEEIKPNEMRTPDA